MTTQAMAVDYKFPAKMPTGCRNGGGGTYNCNSVTLGFGDTIEISGARPATININGNFTTNNANINGTGALSDLSIVVTGNVQIDFNASINANIRAGNVSGGNQAIIYGSITTTTGTINLDFAADVRGGLVSTTGNITLAEQTNIASIACSCDVVVGDASVIAGNVTAKTVRDSGTHARYQGNITTTGAVKLGYGASVSQNIVAANTIELVGGSRVDGCVQSTVSNTIKLAYADAVQGVCCGSSSCSTSCVSNNTGAAMPPSCSSSGNTTPANFNCVAVAASSNSGRLFTQLAGTSFNVDVVALKANGTVETSYVSSGTKNVTLEWVDGTGSTACASRSSLSPAVSQTVSFSSADAGRKTVSTSIAKAYRNLRCRVTDANQTTPVVGCSTDNFAVRPTNFTVTSSNANANNAGTSTTATPVIKAGSHFALTAATGVQGYDGTPLIDNSKLFQHVNGVRVGTLTGGFNVADPTTGAALGTSFSYSEAGYFEIMSQGVYDSSFTAVDAANGDCVTGFNASGGINACSFGNTADTNYFGRFIPDHFAVRQISATTPACSNNFTYFGQDGLSTTFTLAAENAANVTTQNYSSSFAKLDLSNWSSYAFSASPLPAGSVLSASATAPSGSWLAGLASNIVAKHQISRPTSTAPITNLTISAAPVDSDGVTMAASPVSVASPFYFGRLVITNTYGSELLPLSVPIEAQYWNGSTYLSNTLDSCSVVPPTSLAMTNYKRNLAACETQLSGAGRLNSGKVSARLSAPGNGNAGSVDVSVNLNAAANQTCNSATQSNAGSANLPWFGTVNPSSRATFGLYKTPLIYMRENF